MLIHQILPQIAKNSGVYSTSPLYTLPPGTRCTRSIMCELQNMTITVFACGHEKESSFPTKPFDCKCNNIIKQNYSMGKIRKPSICPECEANSKFAKDVAEKDKANRSNLAR